MGPLFVWLLWMIVLVPVGLVIGSILAFGGVPVYYTLRKIPVERRRIRWWHRFFIVIACVIGLQALMTALMAYGFIREAYYADDFYKSQGLTDYWRIPLDYPYELSMIDVTDHASLHKTDCQGKQTDPDAADFPEVSPALNCVREYCKVGPYVVGYMYPDTMWNTEERKLPLDTQWFSFDCSTGQSIIYSSHEEYADDLPRLKFTTEPTLVSVSRQEFDYWSTH